MVVVVIVTILAAIALPSYQGYMRRAATTTAEQEMQKLAEQLERHKARNFTFKGFDPAYIYSATSPMTSISLPYGATGSAIKYTITIRDGTDRTKRLDETGASGQNWAIKAVSSDVNNYTYLLTSTGIRCKNKTAAIVDYANLNCGTPATGQEDW